MDEDSIDRLPIFKAITGDSEKKRTNWALDAPTFLEPPQKVASAGSTLSTEASPRPRRRPLENEERRFYEIDLNSVLQCYDQRTSVMVKNIPNKYTQKMLLRNIDREFAGTYDFFYLPIDFRVRVT